MEFTDNGLKLTKKQQDLKDKMEQAKKDFYDSMDESKDERYTYIQERKLAMRKETFKNYLLKKNMTYTDDIFNSYIKSGMNMIEFMSPMKSYDS